MKHEANTGETKYPRNVRYYIRPEHSLSGSNTSNLMRLILFGLSPVRMRTVVSRFGCITYLSNVLNLTTTIIQFRRIKSSKLPHFSHGIRSRQNVHNRSDLWGGTIAEIKQKQFSTASIVASPNSITYFIRIISIVVMCSLPREN